jgi:hypothetical protein
VFINSFYEIGSNSDIKHAVSLACHHINIVLFIYHAKNHIPD